VYDRSKGAYVPKISSICPSISVEHRLVTDRHGHRHRHRVIASTRASIAAAKNDTDVGCNSYYLRQPISIIFGRGVDAAKTGESNPVKAARLGSAGASK